MAGAAEITRRIVIEAVGETGKLDASLDASGRKIGEFKKRNADAGAGADVMGRRFGTAARGVASAAETIARTGKVGGEAMKQLVAQGSQAALFFGPHGALLGALGISILAIVQLFNRATSETKQLIKTAKEGLDDLQDRGDQTGLLQRARDLEFGKPSAGVNQKTGEFVGSIRDLRVQVQQLEAALLGAGTIIEKIPIEQKLAKVQKQLQELLVVQDDIVRRANAPGPTVRGVGTLPGVTISAGADEKVEDAAADGNVKLRELIEKIRAARVKEFEGFRSDFAKVVAESTGSAVAGLALVFNALIAKANELGLATEAAELTRLRDSAIGTQRTLENVSAELDDIKRDGVDAADEYERLEELVRQINVTLSDSALSDADRAKLNEQLLVLHEQQAKALNKVTDASNGVTVATEKTARAAQQTARAIMDGVNGALQLAEAFGLVDERASTALRSIAQIATSIEPLIEAINSPSYEGRTADIIGGVLSITGAVAALAQSFVSGSSRVDAAVDAFTDAVDRLHESLEAAENATQRPDDPKAAALFDVDTEIGGFAQQAFDAVVEAGGNTLPRGNFAIQRRWADIVAQLTGTLDDIPRVQALLASAGLPTQIRALLAQYLADLQRIDTLQSTRATGVERDFADQDGPTVERTSGTASSVSRATEVQFDRSLALDTTRNALLNQILGVLQAGVGAPISAPALPQTASFGSNAAAGAVAYNVTLGPIYITTGAGDGAAIADDLYREFSRRLADDMRALQRHRGTDGVVS